MHEWIQEKKWDKKHVDDERRGKKNHCRLQLKTKNDSNFWSCSFHVVLNLYFSVFANLCYGFNLMLSLHFGERGCDAKRQMLLRICWQCRWIFKNCLNLTLHHYILGQCLVISSTFMTNISLYKMYTSKTLLRILLCSFWWQTTIKTNSCLLMNWGWIV